MYRHFDVVENLLFHSGIGDKFWNLNEAKDQTCMMYAMMY
jgi:hypothetical protein